MIKVEKIDTWGFEHTVRGMRNPMNSWDKSDSFNYGGSFILGKNDLELMRKLIKAGNSHRKFLRQIFVSMDITAPLYWWKEFDTYKVGTVANSCSTMHNIHEKEFTIDDFSIEHLNVDVLENPFKTIIDCLNFFRELYLNDGDKNDWWQMIQLLPSSYNQKRTVTMNYENILNIMEQRSNHKLDEWKMLITALKNLPYTEELFNEENKKVTR